MDAYVFDLLNLNNFSFIPFLNMLWWVDSTVEHSFFAVSIQVQFQIILSLISNWKYITCCI